MAADGTLNLNYGQLKTLVAGDRLASLSDEIPMWIASAYTDIWNAARWTFKRVTGETRYLTDDGTVTGTPTATPSMPGVFASVNALYDDTGARLVQLTEEEFDSRYTADTTTGRPTYFKVVNRRIYLWPTPDAAYPFTLSYNRRLSHRDSSDNVFPGIFTSDTDLPMWDDHHYIIVVRAKITALKTVTDPTATMLQDEFGRLLDAMIDEYVEPLPRGTQATAWR